MEVGFIIQIMCHLPSRETSYCIYLYRRRILYVGEIQCAGLGNILSSNYVNAVSCSNGVDYFGVKKVSK